MEKQQYRARQDFAPAGDSDKRAALKLNEVVELTDAEADAYGEAVRLVRPYVVRDGHYTQHDETGKATDYSTGSTILLSDAEVASFGAEKFEPVRKPAPARAPVLSGGGAED